MGAANQGSDSPADSTNPSWRGGSVRALPSPTRQFFLWGVLSAALAFTFAGVPAKFTPTEINALAFLSREVPAWRPNNGCFSCHNNGDGARALFLAGRFEYEIPDGILDETLEWLRNPDEWDNNRGEPGFSDKRLARIQFAAALREAYLSGLLTSPTPLRQAAGSLLRHQAPDGSWPIDAGEQVGSPVTYGIPLATAMTIRVLEETGLEEFQEEIRRAREWLLSQEIRSIPEAAALLLIFDDSPREQVKSQRQNALQLIQESQKSDGGWGPFRFSPSEVFDTALALISLGRQGEPDATQKRAIQRGRRYLQESQLESGGWIETTRPSGAESYAQHVSTSAWATQALLETR